MGVAAERIEMVDFLGRSFSCGGFILHFKTYPCVSELIYIGLSPQVLLNPPTAAVLPPQAFPVTITQWYYHYQWQ